MKRQTQRPMDQHCVHRRQNRLAVGDRKVVDRVSRALAAHLAAVAPTVINLSPSHRPVLVPSLVHLSAIRRPSKHIPFSQSRLQQQPTYKNRKIRVMKTQTMQMKRKPFNVYTFYGKWIFGPRNLISFLLFIYTKSPLSNWSHFIRLQHINSTEDGG